MRERPSPQQLAVWRVFLEAHHAVTGLLAEELEEEGLPIGFYDVLVQLSEANAPGLRMAELARRVLLSKSGLTRLVDRMEEEGLVDRRPSPEDGRGYYVMATPRGRAALRSASPTHLEGIARHFSSLLTGEETAVLWAALNRVAQSAVATSTRFPVEEASPASRPDR
jgi:DNA-binding MarR family transcriptional regulator